MSERKPLPTPFIGFTVGENDPWDGDPELSPLHYNTTLHALRRCYAPNQWASIYDSVNNISGAPGTWPSEFAPAAHRSSHQHAGTDEVATATPGANEIPKADENGILDPGWIGATATPTAGAIPIADQNGVLDPDWLGATATAAEGAIPIAGAGGKIGDAWLPAGLVAAGSGGQVQWNDGGDLGADSGFAYSSETKTAGIVGGLTVGQGGTATGQVVFAGTTSGSVTLKPNDAAGTDIVATLPDATGTICVATASSTATQALFATSTAGAPAFRGIAESDLPRKVVNAQTGTTYALVASDYDKIVTCSNADPIGVSVPKTTLGAGFECLIVQLGAGTVTVSPETDVTILTAKTSGLLGAGAVARLLAVATDTYVLTGDLTLPT